jgi:hypothetical protein
MYSDDDAEDISLTLMATSHSESLMGKYKELRQLSLSLVVSYCAKFEA